MTVAKILLNCELSSLVHTDRAFGLYFALLLIWFFLFLFSIRGLVYYLIGVSHQPNGEDGLQHGCLGSGGFGLIRARLEEVYELGPYGRLSSARCLAGLRRRLSLCELLIWHSIFIFVLFWS